MSISIKTILDLDVFKQARLLTNEKSALRVIKAVSVTDVELAEDMIEDEILRPGDFFLSTLAYTQRDFGIFYKNVKILIAARCSGLCITNQYLNKVPDEIIDLCNAENFPLIMIDKDVPYAMIIRRITETIISNQSHVVNLNIINALINGNISKTEKNDLIRRLNPYFKSSFLVFYINNLEPLHEQAFMKEVNNHKAWLAVPYIDGLLVIVTYSDGLKELKSLKSFIYSQGGKYPGAIIGISSDHETLYDLSDGIREALFASNSVPYTKKNMMCYDDLGSIRLLVALQNHQELYNYYHLTIKKILSYDQKYKTSLFLTLEAFVRNDGDYKKTAFDTNQHENTIRYQIKKIKQILNLENQNIQFFETISLGLKAHNILN
ncbi:hypothetical protein EZV73_21265 [Acidaminobacter sp. JC074]|uniref:PucR family transcriptional regulator n=1 Tax=Acidaminobacter sp. JC074 TaxID=2530199 RepID=UPI001F0FDF0F|nr:PucR family transcriptional regulator [Acidaminobacter sp. JC074]MCH4890124.1 hypothetical protein [Acidaminobacter sp. JC074]